MATLADSLRALEASMTQAEIDRTIGMVRAAGWSPGDDVPAFVWAEAFYLATRSPTLPAGRAGDATKELEKDGL